MMIKKITTLFACSLLLLAFKANAQQLKQVDSTLMYINGEGTFINLGSVEKTKINKCSLAIDVH